jgi:hypothetical protein
MEAQVSSTVVSKNLSVVDGSGGFPLGNNEGEMKWR